MLKLKQQMQNFIQDNFFIITSDNCSEFKPRLYGYYYTNKDFFINCRGSDSPIDIYTSGCYVNIIGNRNSLLIQQDFYGLQSLYLYQDKEWFALSNSFYGLFSYLCGKKQLTLNNDFIALFFTSPSTPYASRATAIKEIIQLPPDCMVFIDRRKKALELINLNQNTDKYDLHSFEAIQIIDKVYEKYSNLFTSLAYSSAISYIDITGGMDSRISLCLSTGNGFTEQALYNSMLPTTGPLEDFDIATRISEIYGFHLNENIDYNIHHTGLNLAILGGLMTSFFYNSRFFTFYSYPEKPIFCFTGFGGGILNDYLTIDRQNFISQNLNWPFFKNIDYNNPAKLLLEIEIDYIEKTFPVAMPCGQKIYLRTRLRYHYGKTMINTFLHNRIMIPPLLDPQLSKLKLGSCNNDKNDLYALIIDRYLPDLINMPFDNQRSIKKKTWQEAREINSKYTNINIANKTGELSIHDARIQIPYVNNDTTRYEEMMHNLFNSGYLLQSFSLEQSNEISYFCKSLKNSNHIKEFLTKLFYISLLNKISPNSLFYNAFNFIEGLNYCK